LHLQTSSHVDDALRLETGRSEKEVEKALRLMVGAVAARAPDECLHAMKQFPIGEIKSPSLSPSPTDWWRSMVRAAELLVNYSSRLSPEVRSATSADLAVGCNDLFRAIQEATAEESAGKSKPARKRSTTRKPRWLDMAVQLRAEGHTLKVIAAKVNEKFPGAERDEGNLGTALRRWDNRKNPTT